MEATEKKHPFLPTLAILLAFLPAALLLILLACSAGGNWAFIILGGIVYTVSQVLCGAVSLTLGILSIRRRWGKARGIIAVILSSLGFAITLELVWSLLLKGLLL